MTYAKNCGDSYLPYVVEGEKVGLKMSPRNGITEKEKAIRDNIIDKIISQMNISEGNYLLVGTFGEDEIKESMLNDAVTNIWINLEKVNLYRRILDVLALSYPSICH